jgi:hypothetical protein
MRLVKETLNEQSTFEFLETKELVQKRKKELKEKAFFIQDSAKSIGFTAKKDEKRIVVSLKDK